MDMDLGWFADPLFLGDYPETVKSVIGADLPALSDEDKARIKGSLDFVGINYYTGKWVVANASEPLGGYTITDVLPDPSSPQGKRYIGPAAESFWLRVVPWSFRKLLSYVDARYGRPEIFVTENGVSVPKENDLTAQGELCVREREREGVCFVRRCLVSGPRRGVYMFWIGCASLFHFSAHTHTRSRNDDDDETPGRKNNQSQSRSRTRSASTTTRVT